MKVVRVPRGSRITSLILKLQRISELLASKIHTAHEQFTANPRISELLASSKIQFGLREGLGMTYNRMMGYRRDTISPTLIVVP